jgi:HlyD family secretion protein
MEKDTALKKDKKSRLSVIKKPWIWFKQTRKRNKVIVIVLLMILLVVGLRFKSVQSNKPQYVIAKVTTSDISQIVSETGNISTGARTDVYSPSTGIVEEVYVKNGEEVTEGTQLFKVNSSATEQEQSTARANLLTAQNTLNAAQAQLNALQADMFSANQTFVNGKGTSDPDTDDPAYIIQRGNWLAAEAAYKNQQTVIAQAQSAVNSAALAYQATQNALVKATAAGTVANLSVEVGNNVDAKTATIQPSRPALVIKSGAQPTVQIALNEVDIPKVSEGLSADVTLDAFPGKKFKGTVLQVDDVGTNTQGVITYNVTIGLNQGSDQIKPGMTADVDITVDEAKNVLSVPNAAIKPYQGKKAVQVLDKKTKQLKYIPVTVGIKGEARTQVISGVSEGQEVITAVKNTKPKTSSPFGG